MITTEQYFAGKPHDVDEDANAQHMLESVNELIDEAVAAGAFIRKTCPNTGSEISGSKGGTGDGGFRLPTSTTGSATSSHKEAKAVDIYDPGESLDDWLTDEKLEEYALYREHPDSTPGWCHLTTRAPGSGNRTFHP